MDQLPVSLPVILVCAGALLAGGLVKGTISLGLPLIALPLMMLVIDVKTAVVLLMVPLLGSNLVQGIEGKGTLALARRFWPLLACLAVGTLIGSALLAALDRRTLLLTIGPLAIVFSTASLLRPNLSIPPAMEPWLAPPVGFASGVIGGMSTLFGPILTIYVVGLHLPRDTFVKAMGLIYVVASGFLLIGGASHGTAGPLLLTLSALSMIPVYLGMLIGQRIRHRINPSLFRNLVLGVVWLTGLNMVRAGLGL